MTTANQFLGNHLKSFASQRRNSPVWKGVLQVGRRRTILRTRRRAEQIRASRVSRVKKAPDRRDPKKTEELAELAELRGDIRLTVKTDIDKSDTEDSLSKK
jgi:hypothetical protein